MTVEDMTPSELEAYEQGFYVGVQAKDQGMYNFTFASRRCTEMGYGFGHPHRTYWMKGWLDAGL